MARKNPFALGLVFVAAAAACLPIACSSSDSPPDPPTAPGGGAQRLAAAGDVILGLIVDSKTSVTSLVAAPSDYAAPQSEGAKLHWELRGPKGAIASGDVPDPRLWEAEIELPGPDRALQRFDGRSSGGGLEIKLPNAGGEIILRDDNGEVGRATVPTLAAGEASSVLAQVSGAGGILPRNIGIRADGAGGAAAGGGPVKIVDHGECPANINILIMPEGYTAGEMEYFHNDAARAMSDLETVPGWAQQYTKINAWRQDVASAESGLSDPGCTGNDPESCTNGPHEASVKDTAWNVSYGKVTRRGAWWTSAPKPATWAQYQTAKTASKADVLLVLINSTDHIGAADPSQKIIVQSSNTGVGVVLGHELGHAILNLADEYSNGTCHLETAGQRANVTKTKGSPPWAGIVSTEPFEGAEHCVNGVWRPTENCFMRSLNHPFCPVCLNKLETFFSGRVSQNANNPACVRVKDCATDADGACDKVAPGRNLVCSANGGGKSCCRAPFPVRNVCFSDSDCTTAGEICALATNDSDGGAQFACIKPADQPCVAGAAVDAGAP